MKYAFAFLVIIGLSSGVCAQATVGQDPTAATTAFFKAMLEEDANSMGTLLTDDFMIVTNDGTTADKSLLMQGLSGGYLTLDTGTTSNVARPRIYNTNAAIVTGNWKQKGTLQGQPFNSEVIFTVVCAKMGSDWKIANVQFSSLPK